MITIQRANWSVSWSSCWFCFWTTQGQFFSYHGDKSVYLLGNPIIWWANLAFITIFLLSTLIFSVLAKRLVVLTPHQIGNSTKSINQSRELKSTSWCGSSVQCYRKEQWMHPAGSSSVGCFIMFPSGRWPEFFTSIIIFQPSFFPVCCPVNDLNYSTRFNYDT